MAKWNRIRALKRFVYTRSKAFWYKKHLLDGWSNPRIELPVRIDIHDAEATLNWLRTFPESWMYNEKEIDIGLKEHHYFANAKLADRIVGYTKVAVGSVYLYDFRRCLPLPRDVAFLYHVYVTEEFRKNNIACALVVGVMSDLVRRGYRLMFCHIAEWNAPSMRLFDSLGFRRIADIRFHTICKTLEAWTYRIPPGHRLRTSWSMPTVFG